MEEQSHVDPPSQAAQTAGANKALVRRVYDEGLNRGRLAVLDELISEDLVDHSLFPGRETGRESFRQRFIVVREAFPDASLTVEDAIAEGDKVVYRWTFRGTQSGPFASIAPTGRHVAVTGINITRIADGKIVEHWASFDHLGLLQQLGKIPPVGVGHSGTV